MPGVGLLGATAIAATVTDPTQFRSGRQFRPWLGLTPLNNSNSSGGKERLGRISKMGDQYLRRLLVTGMTSLTPLPGSPECSPRAALGPFEPIMAAVPTPAGRPGTREPPCLYAPEFARRGCGGVSGFGGCKRLLHVA